MHRLCGYPLNWRKNPLHDYSCQKHYLVYASMTLLSLRSSKDIELKSRRFVVYISYVHMSVATTYRRIAILRLCGSGLKSLEDKGARSSPLQGTEKVELTSQKFDEEVKKLIS